MSTRKDTLRVGFQVCLNSYAIFGELNGVFFLEMTQNFRSRTMLALLNRYEARHFLNSWWPRKHFQRRSSGVLIAKHTGQVVHG